MIREQIVFARNATKLRAARRSGAGSGIVRGCNGTLRPARQRHDQHTCAQLRQMRVCRTAAARDRP
jgi:hypothetical protein